MGFPYDYGDELSDLEAQANLQEHLQTVGGTVLFLALSAAAAHASDSLAASWQSKSPPAPGPGGPGPGSCPVPPTTMGIPKPRTPLQRALNTGALGVSLAVFCVNAMWTPTPIGVAVCLIAVTGYVVPPAWTIIIRGIRAGN
jgi:hypothetical protein